MFKHIFNSASYTEEDLLDELLEPKFNRKKIEKIFNSKKMDIDWEDEDQDSLLHICVDNNKLEAVRWLLNNGADINKVAKENKTPIFYALAINNINMVTTLFENGANLNHLDEHERSLAQEAVISCSGQIRDLILKRAKNLDNCDIHGNNLIFDAVANGSKELIEKIVNIPEVNINHVNKYGNSVLQMQTVANNKELAKFLMQQGIDPTLTDATGKNFLFYAISKGIDNLDLIEEAFSLGCDINSRSTTGENLLHEAVEHYINTPSDDEKTRNDYKKIIEQLLLRGIDIDASNNKGENVLFALVRAKEMQMIEFLLNEQIYLNQKNNDGDTVLSLLVVNGTKDLDLINLLLRYNLNPDIQNNLGESAVETVINIILHIENRRKLRIKIKQQIDKDEDYLFLLKTILRESKVDLKQLNSKGEPLFFEPLLYFNTNLFHVLKDHGINLNMKDKDGNNILYALMEHNKNNKIRNKKRYLTTLQSLINVGVNVNTTNNEGSTLLQKAVTEECEYTFRLLLHAKANLLATDKKGRTIMHNCIWKKETEKYFKYIHAYSKELIDAADSYGIQPINYAAFMGKTDLVIAMLDEGASLNNTHKKDKEMMKFFQKFHNNIKNLDDNIYSEVDKKNLRLLKESMIKDFNIQAI